MEVLATRRLSALGTPDTQDLDHAAVHEYPIARPDVAGHGDLSSPPRNLLISHDRSMVNATSIRQYERVMVSMT